MIGAGGSGLACKRGTNAGTGGSATSAPPASASASAASAAPSGGDGLRFERFVTARPAANGGVSIVGVTRDRRVVAVDADGALHLSAPRLLARDLSATDETELEPADADLVLVRGRLPVTPDGELRAGAFLLTPDGAPKRIADEACVTSGGIAWLARESDGTRVHFVRRGAPAIDRTSAPLGVRDGDELHLSCGRDAMAVTARDGEQLTLFRARAAAGDALTFSPAIALERDEDIDEELRDRSVLVRDDGSLAVLRVGEHHLALRSLPAASDAPGPWSVIGARFDDDAELLATAAGPRESSPVWLLASEPMPGKPCSNGDPPRRVVLHTVTAGAATSSAPGDAGANAKVDAGTANDATATNGARDDHRPIVELACGVEAIRAHVVADGERARLWWTEPFIDESCHEVGLGVGAIVEADSDAPGVRHATFVAEGSSRLTDGRWLAVVRKGGCAPYQSEGAGALVFAPTPK